MVYLTLNRGRRRKTRPTLKGKHVEFSECKATKDPMKWVVTLYIDGWPHDIAMWAKDELDVMKQVFEMQRGEIPDNSFDISE